MTEGPGVKVARVFDTDTGVDRWPWLALAVCVGAVWFYTSLQPGLTLSVRVFSALSVGAFAFVLWWAAQRRHDPNQWHYFWVLLVGSVFWYIGESVAIRLGKYEYAGFPLALPSLLGGTFHDPDFLARQLLRIPNTIRNPTEFCHADLWTIPFPVVAFESVVLFSMLRVASLRLSGRGARTAFGAAGQSALLLMSLTAVLDPVVSRTNECGTVNPHAGTSALALWTWFTTDVHQGYWFGVPLVNYVSWLSAAFVFTLLVRLDDERPRGLVRKYDSLVKYALAAALVLLIQIVVCLVVKLAIDYPFNHRPSGIEQRTWQFGVFGAAFLLLGVFAWMRFARLKRWPRTDVISVVPMLTTVLLSLVALSLDFRPALLVVWLIGLAFVLRVLFWSGQESAIPAQVEPS